MFICQSFFKCDEISIVSAVIRRSFFQRGTNVYMRSPCFFRILSKYPDYIFTAFANKIDLGQSGKSGTSCRGQETDRNNGPNDIFHSLFRVNGLEPPDLRTCAKKNNLLLSKFTLAVVILKSLSCIIYTVHRVFQPHGTELTRRLEFFVPAAVGHGCPAAFILRVEVCSNSERRSRPWLKKFQLFLAKMARKRRKSS